jgi:hypothetical protein
MAGQNLLPNSYDPRANNFDYDTIKTKLDNLRNENKIAVNKTPDHASYLKKFGASIVN